MMMDDVRRTAEVLELERALRDPYPVQVRVLDKATLVHRLNEPRVIESQEDPRRSGVIGLPLASIPVVFDETLIAGMIALEMSDGTERYM